MTKVIKFSIVTICKNNLSGLQKTYNSIISQNYNFYQIILVVNDHNKKTLKYLKNIKLKKKNIKIILNKDKNLWDAMNLGLKQCHKDYILFLNSGDLLCNNSVLYNVSKNINKKDNIDLYYGNNVNLYKRRKTSKQARSFKYIFYGMFASHQSMFFKKTLFKKKIFFYDYKNYPYTADYALLCKIYSYKKKFSFLNLNISLCEQAGFSDNFAHLGRLEQIKVKKKFLKISNSLIYSIYFIQFLTWKLKKIFLIK